MGLEAPLLSDRLGLDADERPRSFLGFQRKIPALVLIQLELSRPSTVAVAAAAAESTVELVDAAVAVVAEAVVFAVVDDSKLDSDIVDTDVLVGCYVSSYGDIDEPNPYPSYNIDEEVLEAVEVVVD